MSAEEEKAICILSFDNGGPGTYSQLLLVKDYMDRISIHQGIDASDVVPADYFDLMGGVGFGGLAALMLGHLRMTATQAIDALCTVALAVFPDRADQTGNAEENTRNLKEAIVGILNARNIPLDSKMNDKSRPPKCRVALYAAASVDVSHPRVFRTYSQRGSSLNPTIVEALCATIATPSVFAPVKIGPHLREETFVGGPLGANNPTRELLKEAGIIFGSNTRVNQIISLGTSKPSGISANVQDPSEILRTLATDCEMVASELATRLINVDAYVRFNVEGGNSVENWNDIDELERQARTYINTPVTSRLLSDSLQSLLSGIGTTTLGHINHSNNVKMTVKTAPAVTPYYVVCEKEWDNMVHHLVELPSSKQKIFAITGIGGCGKTQLVSYFIQEKADQYDHAVYVDASSSFSIKADLQAWAQSLGDGHEQDVWEDALRSLTSDLFGGRWVLIFDSADDPKLDLMPFIPQCYNGTVIITSRDRDKGSLSNTHHMELGEMEENEALSTLLKAARRQLPLVPEETATTQHLVKLLGNLAVALVQAGTYCYQMSSTAHQPFTFADYTSIFTLQRSELMKTAESSSLDNYQLGAYAAFDISYKAIPQDAKDFLHFTTAFHYSDISLATFGIAAAQGCKDPDYNKIFPRPEDHADIVSSLQKLLCVDGSWDEIRIHNSIRILRCFSLISASSRANTVFLHLHPLVQAWARDTLPVISQHYRRMAFQTVTCCVNDKDFQVYRHLISHINDLMDGASVGIHHANDRYAAGIALKDQALYAKAEDIFTDVLARMQEAGVRDKKLWHVAYTLASTYRDQARFDEAEALMSKMLEQAKEVWGKGHTVTLGAMESLAITYLNQARFGEAERLQLEIVGQWKKQQGPDHKNTIAATVNLASIYTKQNKYPDAEKLMVGVLQQERRLFGSDHRDTILAAGNLATIYTYQRQYGKAEKLALEVLEQRTKLLGKNHVTTDLAREILAAIYAEQGRWNEAESLQLEVVDLRRRKFGDGNVASFTAARNLGLMYARQKKWDEAEVLERNLLKQQKKVLGDNHPDVIDTMKHLYRCYESLGRQSDLEVVLIELLERQKKILGDGHPDIIGTKASLSKCYITQGKMQEGEKLGLELMQQQTKLWMREQKWSQAEAFCLEVLAQQRRIIGPDHRDNFVTKDNLVEIYKAQRKFREAEGILLGVREQRQRLQGRNHPNSITASSNLLRFYDTHQRWREAEKMGQEVLQQHGKSQGYNHPDAIVAAENLADVYISQKKWKQAEPLILHVLEQRRKLEGESHPRVIRSMEELALIYSFQKKDDEAKEMDKEVLKQRRKMMGIDPPDALLAMAHQATTYIDQKKWPEAEQAMLQVLERRETILGRDHPDTISSMESMGKIYGSMQRWHEAERYEVEVWEQRKKLLGQCHPKTISALDALVRTYASTQDGMKIGALLFHAVGFALRDLGKAHPATQRFGSGLVHALTLIGLPDAAEDIGDLLE